MPFNSASSFPSLPYAFSFCKVLNEGVMLVITDELIQRINELARKQKAEGLTPAEKEEQQQLRQKYLQGIRGSVKSQLDRIRFVDDLS